MYEGAPNQPQPDRFWQIIDKLRRHASSTPRRPRSAPSSSGASEWPRKHDSRALRLLGTVGEPINPEAWMWYHRVIGGERCPIVDTWWQTETGGIMITPLPGRDADQAGLGDAAVPRHRRRRRDARRASRSAPTRAATSSSRSRGPACCAPSTAIPSATSSSTGARSPGMYFTGDGARRDEDGYFWVMGRIDDVVNVAGHRLGTMEVESALVSHPAVAEAAVVGRPDELKGQAIAAFVTLEAGHDGERRAARRSCASTSPRRSAPSPSPTTSASPTRCRRPAAARSCAACCATSPPARRPSATRRRSRTSRCSRSCAKTKNDGVAARVGL